MKRPGWCAAFLVYLRESRGNIAIASDRVPINRKTVYRRMWSDRSFCDEVYALAESFEMPKERRQLAMRSAPAAAP